MPEKGVRCISRLRPPRGESVVLGKKCTKGRETAERCGSEKRRPPTGVKTHPPSKEQRLDPELTTGAERNKRGKPSLAPGGIDPNETKPKIGGWDYTIQSCLANITIEGERQLGKKKERLKHYPPSPHEKSKRREEKVKGLVCNSADSRNRGTRSSS